MKQIWRQVATAVAVIAAGGVVSVAALAQATTWSATAKVPFAFQAEDARLPAGEYTIAPVAANRIEIRDKDNSHVVIVAYLPEAGEHAAPALLFHRYGSSYFLAAVQGRGEEGKRMLLESKEEKKLAREKSLSRGDVAVRAQIGISSSGR